MEQSAIPNESRIHQPLGSGFDALARRGGDGQYSLSVLVRGVHCAGCIQKIERTLAREQDVQSARLNFSTGRLSLSWSGTPDRADHYVRTIENLGYGVLPYDPLREESAARNEERFLLLCLGVAGFAMGNIMLISVGLWTSTAETMGLATRDFMHWLSALIALPAILFSGRVFFRSAVRALASGGTNMDVPISVALILAAGMSVFETLTHGEHVYFDSAVMLMFFLLIGRYLDFRARKHARSSAADLLGSLSGFADVLGEGGRMLRVPVQDLKESMMVRVAAGAKFPADGIIIEGISEADMALVTGESLPQPVEAGSSVFAGTINMGAPVTMRVQKAAEDSLLAEIIRLMEKAGQGQAKYVRVADRAARYYTPVVHILAALAFAGWLWAGAAWQEALMIAVTVLIITCPCALGLAVPVVQVLATGRLMKAGILVKSGDALERLAAADTVMLDKTGTLTQGRPVLQGAYEERCLQIAASLAAHSRHPLSRALLAAWQGEIISAGDVREFPGQGLEGMIEGKKIRIGSRDWCGDAEAPPQDGMELWLQDGTGEKLRFSFRDDLRPDAPEAVRALKQAGLDILLVSGDKEPIVRDMAQKCGIERFYASRTPPQKMALLEEIKAQGYKVLMVGDGLNDTPVLAGADVSMAPGTAIEMAQNAADIVFMGGLLGPVTEAVKTARLSQKLVRQNFALALLYNAIAIPFALAGMVTPLAAAIAMSGSSLLVIVNAFRLKLRA